MTTPLATNPKMSLSPRASEDSTLRFILPGRTGSTGQALANAVVRSLRVQQKFEHPTLLSMLTRLAAVVEDVSVGAAGFLQRIGQDGEILKAKLFGDGTS